MDISFRLAVAVSAVLVSGSVVGTRWQGAAPQVQAPTFRSGISLVPIDVRVVDREGKPITDLKQEDFTILEDNRPQTIRHFSTLSFSANPVASRAAPALRGEPSGELASENRRVFLIVMGRGRHQDVSKYVDALAGFVGRILPQDHVALLAWNRATDFTTDHELVRRTLIRYRDDHAKIEAELDSWFSALRAKHGSTEIPTHIQKMIDGVFSEAGALRPRPLAPSDVAEAQRADRDMRQVATDLQRNAELAERKAAGFDSLPDIGASLTASFSGLTFDEYMSKMTETLQDVGNLFAGIGYLRFLAGEKHLIFVTRNGVSLPSQDGHGSLARVAADARIAMDLVQTGGFVTVPKPQLLPNGGIYVTPYTDAGTVIAQHLQIKDLQLIADRTGGQLMAYRSGEDAFRRLDEAIKFQYLLGYTPSNPAIDGRFRKVTVTVNRPGARILAREGYVASQAPPILDRRELITFNRIRAAAAYGGIVEHLKVRLGRPVVAANDLTVDVTVDVSRVKFIANGNRRAATLEVALFCGNDRSEQVGEQTRRVEVNVAEADFARMQRDGVKFKLTALLRSPATAVKVIVYDYGADLVGTQVAQVVR